MTAAGEVISTYDWRSKRIWLKRRLVTGRWSGGPANYILARFPPGLHIFSRPTRPANHGTSIHFPASSRRGACRQPAPAHPGFACVATLTLALGIAVTTAVFAVVHTVILRTLPLTEPDRRTPASDAPCRAVRRRSRRVIRNTGTCETTQMPLAGSLPCHSAMPPAVRTDGESTNRWPSSVRPGNPFDVLGAPPLLGRTLTPDDDRRGAAPVIVLGYGIWERQFGGERSVLGQRMELNGTRYTVVGVMPQRSRVSTRLRGLDCPRPGDRHPRGQPSHCVSEHCGPRSTGSVDGGRSPGCRAPARSLRGGSWPVEHSDRRRAADVRGRRAPRRCASRHARPPGGSRIRAARRMRERGQLITGPGRDASW